MNPMPRADATNGSGPPVFGIARTGCPATRIVAIQRSATFRASHKTAGARAGKVIMQSAEVVAMKGFVQDIVNTGSTPLKLYTLYAPPNHRDGVVHRTREDAEADDERFDGRTSE